MFHNNLGLKLLSIYYHTQITSRHLIRWTEQQLRKMTSSSNLRYRSVWIEKLFEMINQEFKAQGTKYQVLPNFGTCCRELGAFRVTTIPACVCSFCSVDQMYNPMEGIGTNCIRRFFNLILPNPLFMSARLGILMGLLAI